MTQTLDFNKLLPSSLKNETLTSLMSNLFNRFVSEEKSVYVNGRIGKPNIGDANIQASDLDRELNALIPALYFKSGTEDNIFTFDNFISRLKNMDTDLTSLKTWMSEQTFNYSVPIDYDKLINYSNYYWIGQALSTTPDLSWNTDVAPEYYCISRPSLTSTNKMPVKLATTSNIKLYVADRAPEKFEIYFTSSSTFTVTSNQGVVTSNTTSLSGNTTVIVSSGSNQLCSFVITVGPTLFVAGDKFTIDITYFTSNIFVSFDSQNKTGKGTINGVQTLASLMTLDGVQVQSGDRVLVKNQTNAYENGIYRVVVGEKWIRDIDANLEEHLPVNTLIFVNEGLTNAGKTFKLTSKTNTISSTNDELNSELNFTFLSNTLPKTINDWQEFNFWYHRDDFDTIALLGVTIDNAVQATRPIIEYRETLQLNKFYLENGTPSDSGLSLIQSKTRFNQIPQFDLFRYDGTHAGSTSGIFFYVEDPDFDVDTILQKRVKLTLDSDFIFGTGLTDQLNRILYFKENNELKSVWQAGPNSPIVTSLKTPSSFDGTFLVTPKSNADNQDWQLIAVSQTEFSVTGSRSGNIGNISIGTLVSTEEFDITITAGSNLFQIGTVFTFSIIAPVSPRFVKKQDDAIINTSLSDSTGVWLTPLRMFQNLEREFRSELSFGDLSSHLRSVIRNQDGFSGTSIGNNNVRHLNFDYGLGGTIREFSSNFPLLASMLIERDISPISIIDFAEQSYILAISSIDQFISNELANYFASRKSVVSLGLNPDAQEIKELLAFFEDIRSQNSNLKDVFADTTADVKYWPVTLPMIGLLPAVEPTAKFDNELGLNVIVHHDGHVSEFASRDAEFDRELVRTIVTRSDGTKSAGIFSEVQPISPYACQLWLKPSTFELQIFNVQFDDNVAPSTANTNDLWYQRSTNILRIWDDQTSSWLNSSLNVDDLWVPIDTAMIRNNLLLAVENKLFLSVHPSQSINYDLNTAIDSKYAEFELAKFAAKHSYATYAPDYKIDDAFTWNYSQATINGLTNTPARWHDVLKQYFASFGVIPTCRPNIEPWKLIGQQNKPSNWDLLYLSTVSGDEVTQTARVIETSNVGLLLGLPIVDGVQLVNGDSILLTGQSIAQLNGHYTVNVGAWVRTSATLTNATSFLIEEGTNWANTIWTITTTGTINVGVTPLSIEQIRVWKSNMWTMIKNANPLMKLSVNPATDELLPPYVSSLKSESAEALTTVYPAGISNVYEFGDNGPIETVWKKSLEFSYGLARSCFKLAPLPFLDKTWGETYISVGDNVRVERNLMRPLSPEKFLLHGERLNIVNTLSADDVAQRFNGQITATNKNVTFKVTHCADNSTTMYVYIDDVNYGLINLHEQINLTIDDVTFTNFSISDLGLPFELDEALTIAFNNAGEKTYSHIPAVTKKFKGIGQLFTNLLRYNNLDIDRSRAGLAYRGWTTKLVHRLGALIRPDSLTIDAAQGSFPDTAFAVLLKKSGNTDSKWISGVRVQLVQMGKKRLNSAGFYVPEGDGSDWTFRIENYNSKNPTFDIFELDASGEFQTFYALNKNKSQDAWKRYLTASNVQTVVAPITVTGVQNVVNFMFGYIDRLESIGWKTVIGESPNIDAETSRNLDWQLEIEKFIDRVFGGMLAGEGHILNPFMQKLYLETPIGLMAPYSESNFIDIYSTQALFDVTGTVIPVSNLHVIRTDEGTITYSQTPIFSGHVFIDEFEHIIVMNSKMSTSNNAATIFDQFLGLKTESAYLKFSRQDKTDKKPTFDGYFLSNNNIARNIVSSIDNIGNYYDVTSTFNEPKIAKHALSLLGFSEKDYFKNMGVSDASQFNFWRGLIQAKGTNMTIDAFVNYKKFTDATVDEYWAYKIAEFGDAREKSYPEIKISPSDVTQKFTRLQFDNTNSMLPLYTQISKDDDTRWFSLDDLGKGLEFDASEISETVTVPSTASFPAYIRLQNIYHNGDMGGPTVTGDAEIINASLLKVNSAGTFIVTGFTWMNPTKLSPLKLFDYSEKTLISEIGLWHPAIGIHAHEPLEIINIISKNDPANYNYSTQTVDNSNFKQMKAWSEREVGQVWWDTSNLSYVPYYDASIFPNRDTRHARWGSLAEWASVDLYEWTESSVPPSEYDALASSQEGNSDIDKSLRASGKAAFKKYYSRQRVIKTRPIAWSQAGVGNANAHPSFGPAYFTKIYASGNLLIADSGRIADINLTVGRSFGGWSITNNKPVGEVVIGSGLEYDIGSSSTISNPDILISNPDIASINISKIPGGLFGNKIGQIYLKKYVKSDATFALRMMDSTGFYQDVDITEWASIDVDADFQRVFKFDQFGLQIIVVRDIASTISADDLVTLLADPLNDIFVREAVRFTEIIPLTSFVFINDESDPDYINTEYGWKAWAVPTQKQLDADLLSPHNTWLPYLGDQVEIQVNADVVANMKADTAILTLKSGISIKRFESSWTDWKVLSSYKAETVSDGINNVTFVIPNETAIDVTRLSFYVNGGQVNQSGYEVTNNSVKLLNVLPEGDQVFLLYRAYQPTAAELKFDPIFNDDLSIQQQFKHDYQYTRLDIRDMLGNITGTKYYFWVQDKTIPKMNKNISLLEAKQLLKNGSSEYCIFSRLVKDVNKGVFDSCAITGLNRLVTKNNSFKLRFLRDFTLLDDPEEMNLKNVHSEWTLIRKQQSAKIPKQLWEKLTDAVCGMDITGRLVPSQTRIDYDFRNGTRSKYGFKPGQIFADTDLVKTSIIDCVLNTQLTIKFGNKTVPDYISFLDFENTDTWFNTPSNARATMDLIWNNARAKQINEIFFNVLEDALASNYEFSDIFKTSFITVNSSTTITESVQQEQMDELY